MRSSECCCPLLKLNDDDDNDDIDDQRLGAHGVNSPGGSTVRGTWYVKICCAWQAGNSTHSLMRKNMSHRTYRARRPLTYVLNTISKIQIIQIKQKLL